MRILVVQRSLSPPGGGNAVAAWMVHALCGRHDVATLTAGPWSPAETNAFYGTAIPGHAVSRHVMPRPWRWLSGLADDRLTRLRLATVQGSARPMAAQFDLFVTAEYYAAFPGPGIQYVQYPARLHPVATRLRPIVRQYFRLCEHELGAPWTDAANNVTLTNSRWSAAGIARLGELPAAEVLYPPVLDPGMSLPWDQRDDTFLCIGRFHGSKRIEMAIEIIRRVRQRSMPGARLAIVGSAVDAEYTARIRRIAAGAGDWIEFHQDLSRQHLNRLMARSRFGIQAMENEHFGMATAEMTRAGCLVFAHRSGGTPEVLNDEEALLWTTADEAVERIVALAAAQQLSDRLRHHARRFSTNAFVDRFVSIVESGV